MTLRVYNTLTRQKELFEPVRPGKVGMYLCGPTVYKSPHIGHMVGPVIFDAVKRYLAYKGYEVTWVTNITDVDDKLIDAAKRLNTTMEDLAEKHTQEYFQCLGLLGISSIDRFPRASEHIAEIVQMCQELIDRGHAYAAGGNVWFDVTRDPDYGKLSHRKVEEQASGLRDLEGEGKRHPADFALWKAAKPGEPQWDSPWGPGRPGWHIECSVMSTKYLGATFDIHGGGMDLMFPHHENELAQSESATGQPFVRYWMHNGLTKVRTKSKSGEWKTEDIHETTGNAAQVRVRDLVDRLGPELIRYLLLGSHYRSPIEFSDEALAAAKKGLAALYRVFERVERLTGKPMTEKVDDMDRAAPALLESEAHGPFAKGVLGLKMKFLETMDDDFNTAGAIGVLHELANEINGFVQRNDVERLKPPELIAGVHAAAHTMRNLGVLLGLFAAPAGAEVGGPAGDRGDGALTNKLMDLFIKLRQEARAQKNFALADRIRNGLAEAGVALEDRPDGTGWRKA
ncbi:MAG TPA: cysteine--tRNA ligase [Tepidisphaeraceae bacterium]|nr:cysteine--tRNA ligase [Tepidisphaeraceae bacterium]